MYSSTIFTENTQNIDDFKPDFPIIENYAHDSGAYLRIIGECVINERIAFDDSMQKEFNELASIIEKERLEEQGLVEEAAAIEIVTEGAKEIYDKLEKMVKLAASKIISLYEAVKVRIMAFLTRDYASFYKKHEKAFSENASKINKECKFRFPKGGLSLTTLKYESFKNDSEQELNKLGKMSKEQLDQKLTEIKDGTYFSTLLGDAVGKGSVSRKDFKKELNNHLFEEQKTYTTGIEDKVVKEVKKVLGSKDIVKNLQDAQKQNNDYFKKLLAQIKAARKNIGAGKTGTIDDENYKATFMDKSASEKLNVFNKIVSVNQSANTTINGLYINCVKQHIAQCKSLFVKVVSSAAGKVNEQTYLDAVEENAYYETFNILDSYEAIEA